MTQLDVRNPAAVLPQLSGVMSTTITHLVGRTKGRFRSLRFAFMRLAGNVIVSASTIRAREFAEKNGPIRVLVDSSVLFHGITHESAWVSTGTAKWGAHDIDTGYLARIPVHSPDNDSRTYREVKYLPGIADLARRGYLELLSYAELKAEEMHQPIGRFRGYGYFDLNLFRGISIKSLDGFHVGRRDDQLERVAASRDPVFRSLLAEFGAKSSLDAHHIATAERYGLYAFLHVDFPLAEKVGQYRNKGLMPALTTRVMLPSAFGKLAGIRPVRLDLLSYIDSSFPVRPDLHWPSERRSRPKRKKSDVHQRGRE